MLSPNHLFLREKQGSCKFPPNNNHCVRSGIDHESVISAFPTHFCVNIFSFAQSVSQLVSEFLPEEFFPCIGIDLVCLWVEVSFGGSDVTILDWNSSLDELLARFTKGKSFFLVKFTKNLKRN